MQKTHAFGEKKNQQKKLNTLWVQIPPREHRPDGTEKKKKKRPLKGSRAKSSPPGRPVSMAFTSGTLTNYKMGHLF